jgi:hypothetical protein
MVIDLNGQTFDENNLFTIGGSSVNEANLRCPNENIQFRHQILTSKWSNMLTNGNKSPI